MPVAIIFFRPILSERTPAIGDVINWAIAKIEIIIPIVVPEKCISSFNWGITGMTRPTPRKTRNKLEIAKYIILFFFVIICLLHKKTAIKNGYFCFFVCTFFDSVSAETLVESLRYILH